MTSRRSRTADNLASEAKEGKWSLYEGLRARRADAFAYPHDHLARMAELQQPLLSSATLLHDPDYLSYRQEELGRDDVGTAVDAFVMMANWYARSTICDYIRHPKRSAKEHREIWEKVAVNAVSLADGLNKIGRMASARFFPRSVWQNDDFMASLATIAQTATKEANAPIESSHDPIRLQFAFRLLHGYKSETSRLPARSRSGDAASLLLLAMDPVLEFAHRELGIKEARPLRTAENAEHLIRLWFFRRAQDADEDDD